MDVGNKTLVTVKAAGSTTFPVGAKVNVAVTTDEANLFDKDGKAFTPKRSRAVLEKKLH